MRNTEIKDNLYDLYSVYQQYKRGKSASDGSCGAYNKRRREAHATFAQHPPDIYISAGTLRCCSTYLCRLAGLVVNDVGRTVEWIF